MSSRPGEKRLRGKELKARVDALWKEELEWVRQNPNPDLSTFEKELGEELRKPYARELPSLDIAMLPEDVHFHIDTKDPGKFNNRFIEYPFKKDKPAAILFIGLHHILVLFIIMIWMLSGGPVIEIMPVYMIGMIILGPLIYFAIKDRHSTYGRIRYNRQAQLIHIDEGDGRVAHIPWRQVRPVVDTRYNTGNLLIYAPRPHAEVETLRILSGGENDFLMRPYICSRGIEGLYELYSLEFLRLYMEEGIQAIHSHQKTISRKDSELFIFPGQWLSPVVRIWRWLCFSSLFDNDNLEEAEWPKEVEDLCGPNPDLRGLDTRPIKSRTDIHYRIIYASGISHDYRITRF